MPVAVHPALLASLPSALEPLAALLRPLELQRACALLQTLPAVFDRVGFEARLAPEDSRVDVGICVEHEHAAELDGVASGACGSFVSRWLEPGGVLERAVPHAWFEFDVGDGSSTQAGSPWAAAFPFARLRDGACSLDTIDSLCQVACALTDQAPMQLARPLFDALPSAAYVLHASVLQHRGALELRAEFAANTRGLPAWLEARGVSVINQPVLRFVLEDLPIRQIVVQLCCRAGQLLPHSFELDCGHHVAQEPVWRALFAKLVDARLACESKLQALRAWPGSSLLRVGNEPALVRLTRSFHVTLKLGPTLEAKAYPYLSAAYALC